MIPVLKSHQIDCDEEPMIRLLSNNESYPELKMDINILDTEVDNIIKLVIETEKR